MTTYFQADESTIQKPDFFFNNYIEHTNTERVQQFLEENRGVLISIVTEN